MPEIPNSLGLSDDDLLGLSHDEGGDEELRTMLGGSAMRESSAGWLSRSAALSSWRENDASLLRAESPPGSPDPLAGVVDLADSPGLSADGLLCPAVASEYTLNPRAGLWDDLISGEMLAPETEPSPRLGRQRRSPGMGDAAALELEAASGESLAADASAEDVLDAALGYEGKDCWVSDPLEGVLPRSRDATPFTGKTLSALLRFH